MFIFLHISQSIQMLINMCAQIFSTPNILGLLVHKWQHRWQHLSAPLHTAGKTKTRFFLYRPSLSQPSSDFITLHQKTSKRISLLKSNFKSKLVQSSVITVHTLVKVVQSREPCQQKRSNIQQHWTVSWQAKSFLIYLTIQVFCR